MMTLNVQHIKDYMYCPELYRLSYVVAERPTKYASVTRLYEYAMQKAAYRFFWSAYEGKPLTIGELRKSFGDLFIGQRTKAETVVMNTDALRDLTTMYEQRGVESIKRFYKRFIDNVGTPIIINMDYELVVGDTLLKGVMPIIREYDKEIELLEIRSDYTFFRRSTEGMILSHDIELVASGLAFKKHFQTDLKTFKCYMLASGSTHIIHKKLTDIEKFYTTIASVSRAIQQGIYFPSYNYNCMNCAYYDKCVVT